MFTVAADAYDRYMGRYSIPLAPGFCEFSQIAAGQRVTFGVGTVGAYLSQLDQEQQTRLREHCRDAFPEGGLVPGCSSLGSPRSRLGRRLTRQHCGREPDINIPPCASVLSLELLKACRASALLGSGDPTASA